jgi:hypothetical protein
LFRPQISCYSLQSEPAAPTPTQSRTKQYFATLGAKMPSRRQNYLEFCRRRNQRRGNDLNQISGHQRQNYVKGQFFARLIQSVLVANRRKCLARGFASAGGHVIQAWRMLSQIWDRFQRRRELSADGVSAICIPSRSSRLVCSKTL